MQGTPEKEADWVFSPAHLRGPGENPLPPWAPGIPAISGLRVYLALRLVWSWGRLRKTPGDRPQPHRASLPLHPQGQMITWSPAWGSDPGLQAVREHRPRSGSIGLDRECIPHATLPPFLADVLWGPPPGKENRDSPGCLARRRGSPARRLRGQGPQHMLSQGFLGLLGLRHPRAHYYPKAGVSPNNQSGAHTGELIASRDVTPHAHLQRLQRAGTSAQVTGTPVFGGRPPSTSKANQRPLAQPSWGGAPTAGVGEPRAHQAQPLPLASPAPEWASGPPAPFVLGHVWVVRSWTRDHTHSPSAGSLNP